MADRLKNVKEFYFRTVLDGIGARRFIGQDGMPESFKYLHNNVDPASYDPISADDPAYDPHCEFVGGPFAQGKLLKNAPTEATGIGGVVWFAQLMETDRAVQANKDESSDLYTLLFKPSMQYGCFLDDLMTALTADNPNWREG